jgi:hypothetical protein
MVAYGIGILLLMRCLKQEFPGVKQPWYANSAGTGAPFPVLYQFFERLQEIDPSYGYCPEPDKSILMCNPLTKKPPKKNSKTWDSM